MHSQISTVPTHHPLTMDVSDWLGPNYGPVSLTSTPMAAQTELDRPITVTISREAGTPASEIATRLGQRLGWHVYDRELLEQIAADLHLPAHLVESVDEQRQSWLAEAFGAFLMSPLHATWKPWVSENAYVHGVIKTIRRLGALGSCVIVGRGATFVLPSKSTLRVRLVAPLAHRIANLSRELGVSKLDAKQKIADMDREQREFILSHFHQDPADQQHYDLTLNCSRFDIDAQVEQIFFALCHLELRLDAKKLAPVAQ